MNFTKITESLKEWFSFYQRELPWRGAPSPYAVWISEVMLQQTQVAVVIPYFERWMQLFPDVESLAEAPLEAVIKAWEGLGYYSRARNLHLGAQHIVKIHQGKIPEDADALIEIKGLGSYTIGAIQSFAFKKKVPAVDGNVLRVIARLFALQDEIKSERTKKKITEMVQGLLPDEEPWLVNEALIELGALVCKKKPICEQCPLKHLCIAHQQQIQLTLPINTKKIAYTCLKRIVAVICFKDYFLVQKGEKGIMLDLYEFPYLDFTDLSLLQNPEVIVNEKWNVDATLLSKLPNAKQSFTRFRVDLYPFLFATGSMKKVPNFEWRHLAELQSLPFSSGHRRVVKLFLDSKN